MSDGDTTCSNGWLRAHAVEQEESTVVMPRRRRDPTAPLHTRMLEARKVPVEHRADMLPAPGLIVAGPHINPLIQAARGLFDCVIWLQRGKPVVDVSGIRNLVMQQLAQYEHFCSQVGVSEQDWRLAKVLLCRQLEEAINQQHWLAQWRQIGGFRLDPADESAIWPRLDSLQLNPARHLHLLELFYVCLGTGFSGGQTPTEIERRRIDLYLVICQHRGEPDDQLSPCWRGLELDRPNLLRRPPVWVTLALTTTALTGLYMLFQLGLAGYIQRLLEATAELPGVAPTLMSIVA